MVLSQKPGSEEGEASTPQWPTQQVERYSISPHFLLPPLTAPGDTAASSDVGLRGTPPWEGCRWEKGGHMMAKWEMAPGSSSNRVLVPLFPLKPQGGTSRATSARRNALAAAPLLLGLGQGWEGPRAARAGGSRGARDLSHIPGEIRIRPPAGEQVFRVVQHWASSQPTRHLVLAAASPHGRHLAHLQARGPRRYKASRVTQPGEQKRGLHGSCPGEVAEDGGDKHPQHSPAVGPYKGYVGSLSLCSTSVKRGPSWCPPHRVRVRTY